MPRIYEKKHGGWKTPLYSTWVAMIQRCHNPNTAGFHLYGGRGIKVCERWRHDFAAFREDVGEKPPGKSIDRYPNHDGDYEPGNVRWATPEQQQRNLRRNVRLQYNGRNLMLQEWAEATGLPYEVIRSRYRCGLSAEAILTQPLEIRRRVRNIELTHDGRTQTLSAWAKQLGLNYFTLMSRVENGMPPEKALTAGLLPRKGRYSYAHPQQSAA